MYFQYVIFRSVNNPKTELLILGIMAENVTDRIRISCRHKCLKTVMGKKKLYKCAQCHSIA